MIDRHPLVRLGFRGVLEDRFEIQESSSREEALDLVRDLGHFDVAVVDMSWRRNGLGTSISGTETIRAMRRTMPTLGIVAHGASPERHLANAAIQAPCPASQNGPKISAPRLNPSRVTTGAAPGFTCTLKNLITPPWWREPHRQCADRG